LDINTSVYGGDVAMGKNIGFVSSRFAGTDGVSLEASKWAEVLRNNGNKCYWFAGELDRNPDKSYLVPEAHFKDPLNNWINMISYGTEKKLPSSIQKTINIYKNFLKEELRAYINKFNIETIIAQNCLTIPIQIPLGLALTEVLGETRINTIAHHHDFYWERDRFSINSIDNYLLQSFPPNLPNIKHVVINSDARDELYKRTGIESLIVPNVLDFDNPPKIDNEKSKSFIEELGLKNNEKMFLQPTRVIERKGIESSIDLVKGLNDPNYVLVISHEAGDEGNSYLYKDRIQKKAKQQGVKLICYDGKIADPIYSDGDYNNKGLFNLWDIYPEANLVTFPSKYEGFGNAFLEGIYHKKPLMINKYSVWKRDIEPKGFDVAAFDGSLTKDTFNLVRETTVSKQRRDDMVGHNYEVALNNYSYKVLEKSFDQLMH